MTNAPQSQDWLTLLNSYSNIEDHLSKLKDSDVHDESIAYINHFISSMGSFNIPNFLELLSSTNFTLSQTHAVSLVSECANVYRESLIPYLSKVSSFIIRSLSSESDKKSYEVCFGVMKKIIMFISTNSNQMNDEILHSICHPLALALTEKSIQVSSEGSAHCLACIVQSDTWQHASEKTKNLLFQQVLDALKESVHWNSFNILLTLALIKKNDDFIEKHAKNMILITEGIIINSASTQTRLHSIKLIQEILYRCNKYEFDGCIQSILLTLDTLKSPKLKKQSISVSNNLIILKNNWTPWNLRKKEMILNDNFKNISKSSSKKNMAMMILNGEADSCKNNSQFLTPGQNISTNNSSESKSRLERHGSQNLTAKFLQNITHNESELNQVNANKNSEKIQKIRTNKPTNSSELEKKETKEVASSMNNEEDNELVSMDSSSPCLSSLSTIKRVNDKLFDSFAETSECNVSNVSSLENVTNGNKFTPYTNGFSSYKKIELSSTDSFNSEMENALFAPNNDKINNNNSKNNSNDNCNDNSNDMSNNDMNNNNMNNYHSYPDSTSNMQSSSQNLNYTNQSYDMNDLNKKENSSDESDVIDKQTPIANISREEKLMSSDPRQLLLSLQSASPIHERKKKTHPCPPSESASSLNRPLVSILKSHRSDADVLFKSLRKRRSLNSGSGNWSGSSGGSSMTEKKQTVGSSMLIKKNKKKSARFQGKVEVKVEGGEEKEEKKEQRYGGDVHCEKMLLFDKNSIVKQSHNFRRSASIHSFSSSLSNGVNVGHEKVSEALSQRHGSGNTIVAYVDDFDDYGKEEENFEECMDLERSNSGRRGLGEGIGWQDVEEEETDAEEMKEGMMQEQVSKKRSFVLSLLSALFDGFEFVYWGMEFFLWAFVLLSFSISLALILSRMDDGYEGELRKDNFESLVPT